MGTTSMLIKAQLETMNGGPGVSHNSTTLISTFLATTTTTTTYCCCYYYYYYYYLCHLPHLCACLHQFYRSVTI